MSTLYILIFVICFVQIYFINEIVRNGNILKSNHYRYILVGFSLVIVGALLTILHLPYKDIFLIGGYVVIGVSYMAWTIFKKPIYLLDILKYLWVVTIILNGLSRIYHTQYQTYFIYANAVLFFIMLIVYYVYPYQRHTGALKRRNDDDEKPLDQV